MKQMLQTMGRRGNGLVRFMNSYREVSHLPQPILKLCNAEELLEGVLRLMQNEANDLHLSVPAVALRVIADKEQIEQVLINLIRECPRKRSDTNHSFRGHHSRKSSFPACY